MLVFGQNIGKKALSGVFASMNNMLVRPSRDRWSDRRIVCH